MRLSSVCLVIGLILISASENHAQSEPEELEELDYVLEYFNAGDRCAIYVNETRINERKHMIDLLQIAASGAFPYVATKTALAGLGFTSTGIIKGSFAAAWMSKLAIAGGGGIAKGSSVAILQSLGAAGLGSLVAPLGIGGIIIGAGILYKDELNALYNDEELWQHLKCELKRFGNFIQTLDPKEKVFESIEYMTSKKDELLKDEKFQQSIAEIRSKVDQYMDVASKAKDRVIAEGLPVLKDNYHTVSNYASDVFNQAAESELATNAKKIASEWLGKINL